MSFRDEATAFMTWETLAAITAFVCIVSLLALFANGLVLVAFFTSKQLQQKPSNYFAVNLAVSDICIVLGPMSLWLFNVWYNYNYYVFNEGEMLSREASDNYSMFWHFFDAVLMNVSVSNLAVLSVERYVALAMPIWYRTRITKKRTKIACSLPWMFSVIAMSPFFAFHENQMARYIHKAAITLLSSFVVIISYTMLLCTVNKNRRNENRKSSKEKLKNRREFNLSLRLSLLTVVFLICWLPITTFAFLYASDFQQISLKIYLTVAPSLKFLSYFSSFINPFLYVFGRPRFGTIIKRKLCCRHVLETERPMSSLFQFSKQRSRSACNLSINMEARL